MDDGKRIASVVILSRFVQVTLTVYSYERLDAAAAAAAGHVTLSAHARRLRRCIFIIRVTLSGCRLDEFSVVTELLSSGDKLNDASSSV